MLEQRPVQVDRGELEAALEKFRGDILQVPPMYSAIKMGGKKLYELARKGCEVERPARSVTIKALEIIDQQGKDLYIIRVLCSKGTYIRALCHDIGQALGCGGCMASLNRTMAAGFRLEGSHTLEEVQSASDPEALLMPVDSLFQDRARLVLDRATEKKIRNGMIAVLPHLNSGEYRTYAIGGEFLALCRCRNGKLSAIKSFFEV